MTRNAAGFTLLEIVVVLALIAITGLIIYPSLGTSLEKARMDGCVRDVATLLKYAREIASAEQVVVAVVVRAKEKDLTVFRGTKAAKHYQLWRRVFFSKILVEGESQVENEAVIWFYPDGRSTGLAMIFKNEDGRQLRVKTDILTGYTRVFAPGEDGFNDDSFEQ